MLYSENVIPNLWAEKNRLPVMNFETIEFVIGDALARLTFNRSDKLNSFNAQMHEEVREAMTNVHRDE